MLIGALIGLILFAAFLFFLLPGLSPIPYFPSNKKDIELIIKNLKLSNKQTVYDLGAGDGIVILAAAEEAFRKKLNTQFVAVEINPVLIFILNFRRLFHPNRKNIQVLYADIFAMDFDYPKKSSAVFFMYVSPWYMEQIFKNIKRQIKRFHLVSYFYALPKHRGVKKQGVHDLYLYNF